MIWYYLAGFISGAVGWHMFVKSVGEKIIQERKLREMKGDDDDRGGV